MLLMGAAILILAATTVFLALRGHSGRQSEREEELERQRARYETMLAEMQRRLDSQTEQLRRESALQFRNMAEETMRASMASMREENDRQLDALLTPLKERIETFSRTFADAHVRESASRRSLSDQIERLARLNASIGEEARNLATALRGDSKTQGDWGEMVLETLLENAGMKRDINFKVQATTQASGEALRDEEGRLQRPDVIVSLPGEHRLVIDSKVSLTDYTRMHEAADDQERALFARRHVASVKRHVDELYSKNYQKTVAGAAEHVLMFMPMEGAYLTAVQTDPDLWKYAYDRRVVIVSPTHIFSVMQIIAQMWRQEKQNRNAAEIARQAGALYDVFVRFTEEFGKVGRTITQAANAYDDCARRLSRSPQSLVAKAERLRDLGVKTSRSLSERLLSEADLDGEV